MEQLYADSAVTLEALMSILDVSESTVRRDLDELASENKLRRIHGGAERLNSLQEELSIQQKSVKNIQEKEMIAKKAVTLIQDGDVIFIDAGTTTALLLSELNRNNVTVVTNSIHHAATLVDHQCKTVVIGGTVKNTTDASIGQVAVNQIEMLNFDKVFIGMNGVDYHFLTTPDIEEAAVKRAIIQNARKAYVLVDSTKIGQTSFAKVGMIESVTIITPQSNNPLLQEIKGKTEVIEV